MYHYTSKKTVYLEYGFDSDFGYGSDEFDAQAENIILSTLNSDYDWVDEDHEIAEY